MNQLENITIRHELRPGDLGQVVELHGRIYAEEHGFGMGFEAYVMDSLLEFYGQYDPQRDKVWIVEDQGKMVGFLLLMHRQDQQAQLRYFILEKPYRGMGLGKKLMKEWMDFYKEKGYKGAYLYTTLGLEPAAKIYEHFGFKKISQMKSKTFGVNILEILFRLENN
ncbi:GNAT family N-acetyltransferase [Algoriphagus sp.]|uniref:GNAT family N-acetyltransferase n=1 Tax=Algoriphagus sp. TaxID=1872435 RepID=UPI00260A2CF6|nr:GNAT family N-acetyltransferase [Algoriphagus sp.]